MLFDSAGLWSLVIFCFGIYHFVINRDSSMVVPLYLPFFFFFCCFFFFFLIIGNVIVYGVISL